MSAEALSAAAIGAVTNIGAVESAGAAVASLSLTTSLSISEGSMGVSMISAPSLEGAFAISESMIGPTSTMDSVVAQNTVPHIQHATAQIEKADATQLALVREKLGSITPSTTEAPLADSRVQEENAVISIEPVDTPVWKGLDLGDAIDLSPVESDGSETTEIQDASDISDMMQELDGNVQSITGESVDEEGKPNDERAEEEPEDTQSPDDTDNDEEKETDEDEQDSEEEKEEEKKEEEDEKKPPLSQEHPDRDEYANGKRMDAMITLINDEAQSGYGIVDGSRLARRFVTIGQGRDFQSEILQKPIQSDDDSSGVSGGDDKTIYLIAQVFEGQALKPGEAVGVAAGAINENTAVGYGLGESVSDAAVEKVIGRSLRRR